MTATVDFADPCARAAYLTAAYYRILGGGQAERIRTKSGDSEDDVSFSKSNLTVLRDEMNAAQAECAAKTGNLAAPHRRFALTVGTQRRRVGWLYL